MSIKLSSIYALALSTLIFAQAPIPVGLWQFDGGSTTSASIGNNLVASGAITSITGPTASDGAVHVPKGSYFAMTHGLGATVDEYTLQFDVRIASNTVYHTLFQTDPNNANDAECFINASGRVGITETIYAPTVLLPNQWYRIVIAVKNGARYDTYINGLKVQTGTAQAIGSRFALQSTLLISADNNGENADIDFAKIAIYSKALTDTEAALIGKIVADKPAILAATPQTFTQKVKWNGLFNWDTKAPVNQSLTLDLVKFDNRASNYEMLLQDDNGAYIKYNAGQIYTYLGTVKEYPDAYVAGVIRRNDGVFEGKIYFDRGNTLFVSGDTTTGSRGEYVTSYNLPSNPTVKPGAINDTVYEYSMGFELSNEYFEAIRNKYTLSMTPKSWEDTATIEYVISRVEVSMIQITAMYIYNGKLIPKIGRAIMRTSHANDPWEIAKLADPTAGGLTSTRNHWKAYQTDARRLAVAFISSSLGGGVAWAGNGMDWGFSANGTSGDESFDIVLRHEHGHNWGIGDNHSNRPESATMMCGNQTGRFNGPAVQIISNYRNSQEHRALFDPTSGFSAINIPPYAALDLFAINVGAMPTEFNPIANDHDANNDVLTLEDFQGVTAKGATITRSATDNNRIVYTLPTTNSMVVDSIDFFTYRVKDQNGKIATGVSIIHVRPYGTAIYESEDATYAGVTFSKNSGGYSGTGYVDMNNGKEKEFFIEWKVNNEKHGMVNMDFRYAMGSTQDYSLRLVINDTIVDTLLFTKTANWGTWDTLATQYMLESGVNTIRVTALSTETPNIDALITWNAYSYVAPIPTARLLSNHLMQGPMQVRVYTVQGKLVKSLQTTDGNWMKTSIQGLPSGLYLYKAKQGSQMKSGMLHMK